MAIVNFPERIFKTTVPAIDVVMGLKKKLSTYSYTQNIASTAIDKKLTNPNNWQINNILFSFNNTTSRNFYAKIMEGRNVIEKYNDFLWFQTPNSSWQKITLTPNFYNGTELATQLQTQMNANEAFTTLGITFTVTYDATTGLFTITPSSGLLKYWQTVNAVVLGERDSIAGHLFGLTTDSSMGASVVSDTPAYGLTSEALIVNQESNTSTSYSYTNPINLSIDEGLHITTGTANTIVTTNINYQV